MAAKQMLVPLGQELINGKVRFAGEKPKRCWLDDGRPEPHLGADRTVAAQGTLAQIDVRFKAHGAAMAASMVGFQVFSDGFDSVKITADWIAGNALRRVNCEVPRFVMAQCERAWIEPCIQYRGYIIFVRRGSTPFHY